MYSQRITLAICLAKTINFNVHFFARAKKRTKETRSGETYGFHPKNPLPLAANEASKMMQQYSGIVIEYNCRNLALIAALTMKGSPSRHRITKLSGI
jgi:hypothetical protein